MNEERASRTRWRSVGVFLAALLLTLAGGIVFLWKAVPPADPEALRECPASPVVFDREGRMLRAYLAPDGAWSFPVSLDAMGTWLPKVAVQVEDRRFFSHPGVDLVAIFRALAGNIHEGRVISGASTITSQLVRLTVPRPRTMRAKAEEFFQALRLERRFSKEEILELYLNKAPFGGNIRGVEAASLLYFGKSSRHLSVGEAALLVGLLKSPSALRPDKNPQGARKRRDLLLTLLAERGVLTSTELSVALAEPVTGRLHPFLPVAAHAADRIRALAAPDTTVFRSTLDLGLQRHMERLLHEALGAFPPSVSAAGILVENSSRAVRAYVGNARWGEERGAGWVDCGEALRSPGSTLKPFLYALAFQEGLLGPGSLLADTPLGFRGESPRNFDRLYRGPVSARTALAESLNAPAVRVLRTVGTASFLSFLRRFGFANLHRDASAYGDALVLGGCEVTLLELARAYAALAGGGRLLPLRWVEVQEETAASSSRSDAVVDPRAAFLVAECLRDPGGRLSSLAEQQYGEDGRWVAFKTGTSYGFRDAWTAAYSPRYTVVIWLGDTGGTPRDGLVGLRAATPVALQMLRRVPGLPGPKWFEPPSGVELREVCALSGLAPGSACERTYREWHIDGVSPGGRCSLHVLRNGLPVTQWPLELRGYETGGRPRGEVERRTFRLAITSPGSGKRYVLVSGAGEQKVPLLAEGGDTILYWFVNGEFFARQEPGGQLFWSLTPGKHRISVADAENIPDSVEVEVVASPSP